MFPIKNSSTVLNQENTFKISCVPKSSVQVDQTDDKYVITETVSNSILPVS